MKSPTISAILLLALAAAAGPASAYAQGDPAFYHSLSLAPADASSSGGGGAGEEPAQEGELAKKSLNPVADLTIVPIQNNWDFGIGPANAMRYTANIQPVIPLSLSEDWNLITRTILPVIYAEATDTSPSAPKSAREAHAGLGDMLQSFFFSPKEPVGGWILGGGPALLYPSATDSALGSGKWGAGPTIVALQQQKGWTYGVLANHVWSYAGWGDQNVSSTFLQPFVGFTTKTFTTFMVNSESTYDWEEHQWSVPLNFMLNQMLKVGKQPIQLQLGYRYYAEGPSGGPDWGLRFTLFLFFK
jgi:hypothetical protein